MMVGDRIRLRRLALGMSVDELAKTLGKNRATVYRYESNEIENMPTAVLVPLAQALQTTPGYLMGWECEDARRIHGDTVSLCKDAELQSLCRAVRYMTAEERKKLVDAARVVFKHAFDAAEREPEANGSRVSRENH